MKQFGYHQQKRNRRPAKTRPRYRIEGPPVTQCLPLSSAGFSSERMYDDRTLCCSTSVPTAAIRRRYLFTVAMLNVSSISAPDPNRTSALLLDRHTRASAATQPTPNLNERTQP